MGRRFIVGLLVLLLLAACGGSPRFDSTASAPANAEREQATGGDAAFPPAAEEPAAAAPEAPQDTAGKPAGGNAGSDSDDRQVAERNAQGQFNRLVIRTANIALVVDNVDSTESRLRQIAESRGGYVLGSQVSGDEDQRRAEISFKVPATRFDEALAEVAKLALEVESQDVEGQDVTDQYVDLSSRLRNLQAVEARLIDFLQQAQKVEEALQVNQQLSEIQGQIEEAEGRIAYLKESAAYSTINVSMRGEAVVVIEPDRSWSPASTARNAANSVIAFAQVVADILIVFAVWFPIWLPALILSVWLWRRSRRAPAPTTPTTPTTSSPQP
ncbi:MAG: DUF4349 domain-containing protein [Chloroflexi bacterium]|nr:DUF4349 domain-containing protein [Chloroflexota bacterium]